MSKSVSVILPLFNRDPRMTNYVIADMLKQDIDEVVIANTGEQRLDYPDHRVLEVHNPLQKFLPGIVRNMGAAIANGEIQVHSGADIITASGSWTPFRDIQDGEMVCGNECVILRNQGDTEAAYKGQRSFPHAFVHKPNRGAAQGLTKQTALFVFKGPFDWEMRGWGRVDTDLHARADLMGIPRRWIPLRTIHLWHLGGCNNMVYGKKAREHPDYQYNARLLAAKAKDRGWWSGLEACA